MKNWTEYIKPAVVLLVICIAVAGILAGVNAMTVDAIAANEEAARNESYFSALPDADSFTELPLSAEGVTAVLKADNGAGYVISAGARGYGGTVTAVVAFSNDGEILKVVMDSSTETPGMGSKVSDDSFLGNFIGRGADTLEFADIDAVTGATISSKAALKAVNAAIEAFNTI